MGAGKVLCIIAGIVTLISTYLLAFFAVAPPVYGWGIGFIFQIPEMFTNPGTYGILGIPDYMVYIMAVLGIIFLVAGIFQIIGVKTRVTALIGSIFALGLAIFIILVGFGVLPSQWGVYTLFFAGDSLVEGIIPFHLALGNLSLGIYTLLLGGVLGLIGGIMGPDGF